jgi:NAD(P)-dependent dehydrogenase (short-subunit alcohol dehydrogenase family)
MKLEKTSAIVTGATGGLGGRIAKKFWAEGASLALTGRNAQALRELAESLPPARAEGQKLLLEACDLAAPGSAARLFACAEKAFGAVTVLVNNAAVLGPIGPLEENDRKGWEQAVRVNLLVPAELCALVLPGMRARGYGKIVNLSGGGAAGPRPNFTSYAAAKAALVRLSEILALENAGAHIDVNCLAPGIMKTRMVEEILAAGPGRVGRREHARLAEASAANDPAIDRAAELALFLASAESDGITGRLISAAWDSWQSLPQRRSELAASDVYTLRRIVPRDRGYHWN